MKYLKWIAAIWLTIVVAALLGGYSFCVYMVAMGER